MSPLQREWTKSIPLKNDGKATRFLLSMDKSLISAAAINKEYAKDYISWANPLPEEVVQQIIDGSVTFGMYKCLIDQEKTTASNEGEQAPSLETNNLEERSCPTTVSNWSPHQLEQIGFARLVTDQVTFFYLADVYIQPQYQGSGLGTWMLQSIDEVLLSMPHLRRFILVATGERGARYYAKNMNMAILGETGSMVVMGRTGPGSAV
ncbi:hypothetical protein FQN57_003445 [Myotisia sp. PD_48]|nr:hypothetical protein FQN57_003445 [Myotisia sp. PD_48]